MSAQGRSRIGLVADTRLASFGHWRDVSLSAVWSHYVEALDNAGAAPVLFPVVSSYEELPGLALEVVDGLLLTGGRDLDAATYGADANPANEAGDPLRDRIEMALALAAIDRGMPLLGVCRGMQVLNVALGGGIEQHLPDPDGVHRGEQGAFTPHPVTAVPGTRTAAIIGADEVQVQSHHHQGVEPLADGLVASAHSPDGLVEAAERPGDGYCVAVLWHPEEDLTGGGQDVYDSLAAAAAAHREQALA